MRLRVFFFCVYIVIYIRFMHDRIHIPGNDNTTCVYIHIATHIRNVDWVHTYTTYSLLLASLVFILLFMPLLSLSVL